MLRGNLNSQSPVTARYAPPLVRSRIQLVYGGDGDATPLALRPSRGFDPSKSAPRKSVRAARNARGEAAGLLRLAGRGRLALCPGVCRRDTSMMLRRETPEDFDFTSCESRTPVELPLSLRDLRAGL